MTPGLRRFQLLRLRLAASAHPPWKPNEIAWVARAREWHEGRLCDERAIANCRLSGLCGVEARHSDISRFPQTYDAIHGKILPKEGEHKPGDRS
jgi:hypothetical protein